MTADANKATISRLFDEYFNHGNEAVWDEVAHPDVVIYGVNLLRGAAAAKAFYATLRATFPDWHASIEDLFGEGDRVAVRITESGTMHGPFLGMEPTGKRFEIPAIQICRLEGGKLVEMWGARDTGSMVRQLGAVPSSNAPER